MSDPYDEFVERGTSSSAEGSAEQAQSTVAAPVAATPAEPEPPVADEEPVSEDEPVSEEVWSEEVPPVHVPVSEEEWPEEVPSAHVPVSEEEWSEEVPSVQLPVSDDEVSEGPFADWPQGASAEVIEDVPEEGEGVEHVSGEIDVPDGYSVLEGTPTGHRRSVAIVVSRFNGGLTNRMLAKAIETLEDAGVAPDAVTVMPVPGAFELPLAAMALAKTRRYACVVALGVIVRGETPHFDYIAAEAASGLQLAAIETGVPCAFGVLTVETVEQAEARIERAADAVRSALEMADVFAQLRASERA
jgi:6,7-dimethyl-8-ribityllumazine synthase